MGSLGVAAVLAIGTANPPNCFNQVDYPDFYFRLTKTDHNSPLKDKFRRICDKSGIKKRYMHLTEDIINENPNLIIYKAPSFDARQEILVAEVRGSRMKPPRRPSKNGGNPFRRSPTLYFGCFAAGTALRLAKDLAENNAGARVLVVCSENMVGCFQPPSETHLDVLVGSALFSDGAAAVIVGANPDATFKERPLFQIMSAKQHIIPDSDDIMVAKIREMVMAYYLSKRLPKVIAENIEQCLIQTFLPLGIDDLNKLFYVVHPGGPAILRQIEEKLGLGKDKLKASWHVLSEYGNMWSPTVLFVLDEMRKNTTKQGEVVAAAATAMPEGLEWGVLLAFGPGLTVETVVLRSLASDKA
ncbi:hypothetical protein V6N11_070261 [Hibiscus sabdariffa]|uniref:Chalcone synthase n=1 Tax=Hibiscus sabdariffa TaxID=183260 RepID=A0ABR2QEI0_9ROSI